MRKYYRHFRRMEPWAKLTMWVEKGYMKPPANYNLLKLFPPRQYAEDFPGYNKKVKLDPNNPMTKLRVQFLKKYPQYLNKYKGADYENDKLLETFIKKQFNLMKEGFSEVKAFDIVEKEFSTTLAAEKHDRLLFEGVNLTNRTRSLMDTFEQREEFIQRQKTKRLERDLPEFLRAEYYRHTAKDEVYKSLIDKNTTNFNAPDTYKNSIPYDPVMYYLSTNPNNDNNEDMKKENFLKRSENVMNYYHSYFEFSDGLSRSTTMDIQKFAKETNQRFKNYFGFLVKKLEKHRVSLDEKGNIDYTKIESQGIKAFIKKNETICTVILLSKDLDFEVPHLNRISEIKRDILEEIEEEYKRLEELYTKKEESIREKPKTEVSSYEEIFKYASDCKFILK